MGLPRVLGHRGVAALAPENTLESLRLAADLGAPGVEFDVKLTADAVPVLMHDDTLDRTTDGHGPVAAAAAAAVAGCDAGAWFAPEFKGARVPTLAAALDLVLDRGLFANIEIKASPGTDVATTRATCAALCRQWPQGRPPPLLSSFSRAALAVARYEAPELPRGLLIWERPAEWAAAAADLDCGSIHCADRFLTSDWAAEIKALGFKLAVYTVNDPARARVLFDWGVDCVISDRPDLILAGA